MSKYLFLILLAFSLESYSENYGDFGLAVRISGSGYIFPKLKRIEVTQVKPNSSAEAEGVSVGDLIISINDCKIPGCSARKAKASILKGVGEQVSLELINHEGQNYRVTLTAQPITPL